MSRGVTAPTALGRAFETVERWFLAPVPAARLGAVRALIAFVAFYDVVLYSGPVFADAAAVSDGGPTRPWTPIYYFELLGVQPIGAEAAHVVYTVTLVALGCAMLGLCGRLACAIAAVGFLYWTGLAYSFGKPHHDKVALAFAVLALPFARVSAGLSLDALLVARWRRWRSRSESAVPAAPTTPVAALPITLTAFTLALGYCGAGLAKLLLGGLDWFNGYTLQGIMLGHDGPLSRVIGADVWLCQLQSIGTVFVQTTFPVVLLWPRSRWFYLPAATGFHLMTWATMDTGPFARVWLLLWVFVPLERVPALCGMWVRAGGLRAGALVVGGAAYLGLVVWIVQRVAPVLAWSGLAVVLAALGSGILRRPNPQGGLAATSRDP